MPISKRSRIATGAAPPKSATSLFPQSTSPPRAAALAVAPQPQGLFSAVNLNSTCDASSDRAPWVPPGASGVSKLGLPTQPSFSWLASPQDPTALAPSQSVGLTVPPTRAPPPPSHHSTLGFMPRIFSPTMASLTGPAVPLAHASSSRSPPTSALLSAAGGQVTAAPAPIRLSQLWKPTPEPGDDATAKSSSQAAVADLVTPVLSQTAAGLVSPVSSATISTAAAEAEINERLAPVSRAATFASDGPLQKSDLRRGIDSATDLVDLRRELHLLRRSGSEPMPTREPASLPVKRSQSLEPSTAAGSKRAKYTSAPVVPWMSSRAPPAPAQSDADLALAIATRRATHANGLRHYAAVLADHSRVPHQARVTVAVAEALLMDEFVDLAHFHPAGAGVPVASVAEWVASFRAYAACSAFVFPEKRAAYDGYLDAVMAVAVEFKGIGAVLVYDECVRRALAMRVPGVNGFADLHEPGMEAVRRHQAGEGGEMESLNPVEANSAQQPLGRAARTRRASSVLSVADSETSSPSDPDPADPDSYTLLALSPELLTSVVAFSRARLATCTATRRLRDAANSPHVKFVWLEDLLKDEYDDPEFGTYVAAAKDTVPSDVGALIELPFLFVQERLVAEEEEGYAHFTSLFRVLLDRLLGLARRAVSAWEAKHPHLRGPGAVFGCIVKDQFRCQRRDDDAVGPAKRLMRGFDVPTISLIQLLISAVCRLDPPTLREILGRALAAMPDLFLVARPASAWAQVNHEAGQVLAGTPSM
ncbi:hypothetical protein H9P43_007411 [Blastocladiella emersonii ATCC 22665]|nr:hypothetical protein H9P43_007411 [Blastocladiella emersonii ATCC 22665]